MLFSALRSVLRPALQPALGARPRGAGASNPIAALSPLAWYDQTDLTTMFQDAAATVLAVVDSPVYRINDKSGHGHPWLQPTPGNRWILRQLGDSYGLELDGSNDGAGGTAGGTGWEDVGVFLGWQDPAGARASSLYFGNGLGTYPDYDTYFGRTESGGGDPSDNLASHPDQYVDGVAVSPNNRGAFFTATNVTTPLVLEWQGVDWSAQSNLSLSPEVGVPARGYFRGLIIVADPAAKAATIRTWLAAQQGRVL